MAAHFTDDGVFVTDRGPVYGPQAIEKWYADSLKELHNKNFVAKADDKLASGYRYGWQRGIAERRMERDYSTGGQ